MKRSTMILLSLLLSALFFLGLLAVNARFHTLEPDACVNADMLTGGPFLLTADSVMQRDGRETLYRYTFRCTTDICLCLTRSAYPDVYINGALRTEQKDATVRYFMLDAGTAEAPASYSVDIRYPAETEPSHIGLYLGTLDQLTSIDRVQAQSKALIHGMCVAVTLFSLVLFYWKRSERYLLWVAVLSFLTGDYRRLYFIFKLLRSIPLFAPFMSENVYQWMIDVPRVVLQYLIIRQFLPCPIGKHGEHSILPVMLLSSLLPLFLSQNLLLFPWALLACYAVFDACFGICFLRAARENRFSQIVLTFAWAMVTASRLFDCSMRAGLIPLGTVETYFRLRGFLSCIYFVAFFLLACQRFANKFQEADDLNCSLETTIREKTATQTLFIRSMLHNLKTPLFSLSGYADMASSCVRRSPEQALAYIKRINEKANYVGRLLDQLFLITQMDAGQIIYQQIPTDLCELMRTVADTTRLKAASLEISLSAPQSATVPGDPLYLQQAFQCIADNAIEHTQTGSLRMRIEAVTGGYTIVFSDTGCGIPADVLPKIFDRYYSNHGDKPRSSGLGLTIASQIVRHHNGNITAESTPGKGSDFTVFLPS